MNETMSHSLEYTDSLAVLTVQTPELDLEHAESLALEVHSRELVFTAPPYYARIPVDRDLLQEEVFPNKIDYEKSSLRYHIPLQTNVETESMATLVATETYKYGFGNLYEGTLTISNSQDFKTLSNPERYSNETRRQRRLSDEQNDFNAEHFGMDHVQYIIDGFGLESVTIPAKVQLSQDQQYRVGVIVDEKKRHLVHYQSWPENGPSLNNLVDILLAVLYDKLTNNNELNEAISHVNIHRLSASLSFFEELQSAEATLIAFYRRSCIYPFHRSKNLAKKCAEILVDALAGDDCTDWVLEKLMYCYDSFRTNDCVVLNHYFIKDYIRLIRICPSSECLRKVGQKIAELLPKVHDQSLGFGEDVIVRKFIKDIIGYDDDLTDSDDTSGSEEDDSSDSESTTDADEINKIPEENVLEKLMNLKIQS